MRCLRLRTRAIVLVLVLLGVANALHAQFLGFDWGVETRHDYRMVGRYKEAEILSLDLLEVVLEGWQGAGNTTLHYVARGGVAYSPQVGRISDNQDREALPYAGETAVYLSWPPAARVDPWLSVGFGRIPLFDPSGLLLVDPLAPVSAQLVDGASFMMRAPRFFVSVEAGYTGLLDKDINRIRLTEPDRSEAADSGNYFAPQRLVVTASGQLESVFSGQNGGAMALIQQDLRPSGETQSDYYLGVISEGPVAPGFSQRSAVFGAYTVPDPGESGVAVMVAPGLWYQIPLAPLDEGWFQLRWASSPGETLRAFPAPAGPVAGTVFSESLSDLVDLQLGIDASLPVPPGEAVLVPTLTLTGFFVPSGDIAPETGIEPSGGFAGVELALELRYILQEDLSVEVHGAWHFLGDVIRSSYGVIGRIRL